MINNAAASRSHARARPTSFYERTAVWSDVETRRCHRRLVYMTQPALPAPFAADLRARRMHSILMSNIAIFAVLLPARYFPLWGMRYSCGR
jgi:hypothetical protein